MSPIHLWRKGRRESFHPLVVFLLCGVCSPWLSAYEVFPEFRTLQSQEVDELQGASKIDSEYQSDMLTFQKPLVWEYQWLKSARAFDLSVGSLSGKRFALENRLQIQNALTDKLNFRFVYFDQSHLEESASAHMIELSYRLSSKWALAVYGDGSTYKSEDDVGMALIYTPTSQWQYRLFYTATDFSRNKRNEQEDRFSQRPKSYGGVVRWWESTKEEYLEAAFRVDEESRWQFPQQGFEHVYGKKYAGIKARKFVNSQHYVHVLASALERLEEMQSRVEFVKGEYQMQYGGLRAGKGEVLLGLQYVDRLWRQPLGEVRQKNLLPHLWWLYKAWNVGYEFTVYSSRGPRELRSGLDKDSAVEHRLNVSYTLDFKVAYLRWLFTFDLDRFGSSETWEGGSGQFITWF